jgi:hypothetical protein
MKLLLKITTTATVCISGLMYGNFQWTSRSGNNEEEKTI